MGRFDTLTGWFRIYLLCLLPRMALLLWKAAGNEDAEFLYEDRSLPFWDPLPVLFHQAFDALVLGNRLVLLIGYALVSALIAPLIYGLARVLNLSTRSATWAALGVSFYPYYVSTSWYQPEEGVAIALTATFVLAAAIMIRRPSAATMSYCAVASALLYLNRAHSVIFILFLFALIISRLRHPASHRRLSMVLAASFVATLGILTGLNYLAFQRPSPLPAKGAYNLFLGHNAAVGPFLKSGVHRVGFEFSVADEAFRPLPVEVKQQQTLFTYSGLYREEAWRFVREHPKETLVNTVYKLARYWDWRLEDADAEGVVKNGLYTIPYFFLLMLAMIGWFRLFRDRKLFVILLTLGGMVAFSIPSIMTIPIVRTRMNSEFLLILVAGGAFEVLLSQIPGKGLRWDQLTKKYLLGKL